MPWLGLGGGGREIGSRYVSVTKNKKSQKKLNLIFLDVIY